MITWLVVSGLVSTSGNWGGLTPKSKSIFSSLIVGKFGLDSSKLGLLLFEWLGLDSKLGFTTWFGSLSFWFWSVLWSNLSVDVWLHDNVIDNGAIAATTGKNFFHYYSL